MSGTIGTSHSKSKIVGKSQDTAKVWANFDGSSFGERDSFNCSGFTDNGTGDYTVSFTNAMANTNYAAAITGVFIPGPGGAFLGGVTAATGSIRIKSMYITDFATGVSAHNVAFVSFVIFGD